MQQKSNECVDIFNKFIRQIEEIHPESILERAEHIYAVRQFKIVQLSSGAASEIYQNVYLKFNRNFTPKFQLNWWENQLRIFVWVLVLYVQLKKTKIQDLTSHDWEFFSLIFPHKKEILFEYQSINILKQHGQAKKWVPDEDQLFGGLVNEKGIKCKWSQLAKLLYIQSQKKFFRTPKQCRQRWLNHLDPSKSKCQWTAKQDYVLIRYVHQKGKRWAQISKILQNKRNQHSIKNRFKSLITKELKHHKEKLQEAQLISFIYKRYTSHLNNLNSNVRSEEDIQQISPKKSQNLEKFLPARIERNELQNQQNHFFTKSLKNKSSQKLMFPFSWYPRNKDEQVFMPFRRSQQYIPCKVEQKQFRNTIYSGPSMQQLTNPYTQHIYSSQASIFSKFKSQANLPKKTFEDDENSEQNYDKNFYSSILGENYNAPNNDLTFSHHYEQFFPILSDQFEESPSLQQQIFPNNQIIQAQMNSSRAISFQNQMDDEQKRIRAEIFLAQDPFQLLKPFFFKKTSNSQNQGPI